MSLTLKIEGRNLTYTKELSFSEACGLIDLLENDYIALPSSSIKLKNSLIQNFLPENSSNKLMHDGTIQSRAKEDLEIDSKVIALDVYTPKHKDISVRLKRSDAILYILYIAKEDEITALSLRHLSYLSDKLGIAINSKNFTALNSRNIGRNYIERTDDERFSLTKLGTVHIETLIHHYDFLRRFNTKKMDP